MSPKHEGAGSGGVHAGLPQQEGVVDTPEVGHQCSSLHAAYAHQWTATKPCVVCTCYLTVGQILFARLGGVANRMGLGVGLNVRASTEVTMGAVPSVAAKHSCLDTPTYMQQLVLLCTSMVCSCSVWNYLDSRTEFDCRYLVGA